MKKLLLLCAVAASFGFGVSAEAQTTSATSRNNSRATGTITRSNARAITRQQRAAQAPIVATRRVDGAVTRTIRANDPLQMVNPGAAAEYGSGREVTRHEVDDPYQRPQGIKLVSIEF